MRIADLTIKNFRGIREGKINFGRHTVLVGPNSSGKTTVIEALTTLFGRDRLIRTLTEHDFFGCDPQPADRIQVVATVVDFAPNMPDDHFDWFRPGRAVPKWYDPATGQLHADKVDEGNLLAAQIGFAGRFDQESLEVETVRYFHDDDSTTDPFSEEQCVPVPLIIKELGFFLIPANRAWERMISFDSELFRRVVAHVGGLPANAVREERARLWKPEHPLETDAKLKDLVEGVNKELAGIFGRKPELRLRLTGTDSDSVLEAITPHFQFADGPPIPSRRQGMGVLSLQSIILLLQLAQHRATQGKSFCLALEEPELHVLVGMGVTGITRSRQGDRATGGSMKNAIIGLAWPLLLHTTYLLDPTRSDSVILAQAPKHPHGHGQDSAHRRSLRAELTGHHGLSNRHDSRGEPSSFARSLADQSRLPPQATPDCWIGFENLLDADQLRNGRSSSLSTPAHDPPLHTRQAGSV